MKRWSVLLAGILLLSLLVTGLPVFAQDGDCARTSPTHFQFGDRVRVVRHPERAVPMVIVFLMSGPGWSSPRVDRLHSDEEATIQSHAPVCDGGYEWWFLMADDGRTGWAASAVDMGDPMYEAALELVSPPSEGAQPASAASGGRTQVIFEDDFSNPASGWPVGDSADANGFSTKLYVEENATYRVLAGNNLRDQWSNLWLFGTMPELQNVPDFHLEVDMQFVVTAGSAGIFFRSGRDRVYLFHFDPVQQTYGLILEFLDGTTRTLVEPTYSAAIHPDFENNRLGITAEGSRIRLYANDQLLTETSDSTYTDGGLGFWLSIPPGGDNPPKIMIVEYDNLIVTGPDGAADTPAPVQPVSAAASGGRTQVIFEDDFSRTSNWPEHRTAGFSVQYHNERYSMAQMEAGYNLWEWPLAEAIQDLADFTASVDVIPLADRGMAGLSFRHSNDGFYYLIIGPGDQTFQLMLYANDEYTTLIPSTFSEAIAPFPDPTRIQVTAVGDQIALYANDEPLAVIEHTARQTGQIGLFVFNPLTSSASDSIALFNFDNLLVLAPQPVDQAAFAAAPACQASASRNVNVRSGPGEDYTVLGSLSASRPLPVSARNGGWLAVTINGREGWVAGWIVTLDGPCDALPYREPAAAVLAQQAAPQPTPAPAQQPAQPPTQAPQGGAYGGVTQFTVNGSSEATINAGQCATVRWNVEGVQGLYYQGQGVTGQGERQECPTQTTTYELRVAHRDGNQTTHTVRINVNAGREVLLWVNGTFVDRSGDFNFGRIDLCGVQEANLSWQVSNTADQALGEYCTSASSCGHSVDIGPTGSRTYQRSDVLGLDSLFVVMGWTTGITETPIAGVYLDFTCP